MTNGGLGLTDLALVVPRGSSGLDPIHFDLTDVINAERKIKEIQLSNPLTFPELATTYNIGIAALTKMIGIIKLETADAKRELTQATSIFKLDKAEEVLAQKKLKSSVDMREAASAVDPQVKASQEKYDILIAIAEYLQDKRKDLERTFYAAREVAGMQMDLPDKKNYGGRNGY